MSGYRVRMKSVYDVRRENLRQLMKLWGGPTSLAKKLGHAEFTLNNPASRWVIYLAKSKTVIRCGDDYPQKNTRRVFSRSRKTASGESRPR